MSNNTPDHRENERKFIATDYAADRLEDLGAVITEMLKGDDKPYRFIEKCDTKDGYSLPPAESYLQFARTRDSIGVMDTGEYKILKEITVKQKDRGDNRNRLEVNLGVDSIEQATALLALLTGRRSVGTITKKEQVWFIPVAGGEVVISTALILESGIIYLEVEGPSDHYIRQYVGALRDLVKLVPEPRSFYEIYIEPKLNNSEVA